MLISAWVVLYLGIVPYGLGSNFFRTAGLKNELTTSSSAIFDTIGVREIGRKSLLTFRTSFALGIGIIFVNFQEDGSRLSL